MHRLPVSKARALGADIRNPARHEGRNDPTVSPLGDASNHLDGPQQEAWQRFQAEIPWLVESDRAMVEVASILRARVTGGGEIGVNQLQTFSAVLSKLGATPVDRSRIAQGGDNPDENDEFFS